MIAMTPIALFVTVSMGLAQSDRFEAGWPNTDFSRLAIDLGDVISGGPPRDGIGGRISAALLIVQVWMASLVTPAMQDDGLAGLYLPLRVLVYEDAEGQVWLSYEDPAAMLGRLDGIGSEAPYLERMRGALRNLTAAAASE